MRDGWVPIPEEYFEAANFSSPTRFILSVVIFTASSKPIRKMDLTDILSDRRVNEDEETKAYIVDEEEQFNHLYCFGK